MESRFEDGLLITLPFVVLCVGKVYVVSFVMYGRSQAPGPSP